eukprot:5173616-Prymnesium_polylepis.1
MMVSATSQYLRSPVWYARYLYSSWIVPNSARMADDCAHDGWLHVCDEVNEMVVHGRPVGLRLNA